MHDRSPKPFPWIKTIEPYLAGLQPLSNIEEMETEALRMDNCLKKLVGQAAAGYRLYFWLRSGPAVTAELRKAAAGGRARYVDRATRPSARIWPHRSHNSLTYWPITCR